MPTNHFTARYWTTIFAVLIAWTAGTTETFAHGEPRASGSYSHLVTGSAGQYFFDLSSEFESSGVELEGGWGFGGRYQYNLTNHWGIEANGLYSPLSQEIGEQDGGSEEDSGGDENEGTTDEEDDGNALYFTGNVVYNFRPGRRLMPFVTGGAGIVRLDVSDGDTQSKPAGVFGGGVLFGVTKRLLLRFDVRDYIHTARLLSPERFEKTINNLSLTGGVSFRF